MRKKPNLTSRIIFVFGLFIISTANHIVAQAPKLFITIVSHNEDNIGYDVSSSLYYSKRLAMVGTCNMFQTKNVKYNYGGEWVALEAIANLDTGSVLANTNGKNILRWLVEDLGFECDPHSHETTRNYADVHYLMSQLGITPSNTMSGFLYDTLQNGVEWDDYENGVTGIYFPSHTWYPKAMWGAATPMHTHDPELWGVFKPQDINNFFVHNPTNNLRVIGTGCPIKIESTTTIGEVDSLIDQIVYDLQNGILPNNGIYTQEIFFSEGKVTQPWFTSLITAVIDSVNTHVMAGTVEWKSLNEILNYWQTSYDSIPFAVDCSHNDLLDIPNETYDNNVQITVYPNPVRENFTISFGDKAEHVICIYNLTGEEISTRYVTEKSEISTINWSHGIYFIQIDQSTTRKLIK